MLDMLERISSVNGFSIGLAFLQAVEKINDIAVPDKANYIRLVLNEMSFLRANLWQVKSYYKMSRSSVGQFSHFQADCAVQRSSVTDSR